MSSNKSIIVIGSGPGIGVATASHFASQGFSVALLSRNSQRLEEDASKVKSASNDGGVSVKTYAVDVGDHQALKQTLDKVKSDIGAPEVILFNAARVAQSTIGEEGVQSILDDFKITNIGLYTAATWALPILSSNKSGHPSFLITGGGLWEHPMAEYFSLSMQKAAQVNFAQSFSQVAGPKGVHVATVSVNGVVKDDDPVINAKNVAGVFWKLYQQGEKEWEDLVNVGSMG